MPAVRGGHNRKGERNAQLRADWCAGMSVGEIADKYGLKRQRVHVLTADLRRKGEYRTSTSLEDARRKRDEAFVAGWNAGGKVSEMAAEADVNVRTVYLALWTARDAGRLTRQLGRRR